MKVLNGGSVEDTQTTTEDRYECLKWKEGEETLAATEDRYESLKWKEGRGDAGSYRGQV